MGKESRKRKFTRRFTFEGVGDYLDTIYEEDGENTGTAPMESPMKRRFARIPLRNVSNQQDSTPKKEEKTLRVVKEKLEVKKMKSPVNFEILCKQLRETNQELAV